MSADGDGSERGSKGQEPGEVALVVLCIVGLVLGGVLAPAPGADDSAGGPGVDLSGLLSELLQFFAPGEPQEFPQQDDCVVAVLDRPAPGATVRVKVYENRDPVAQRKVWFNDEFIGRTDRRGLVAGAVPYDEELEVRVSNPRGGECRFVEPDDVPRRVRYQNRPGNETRGSANGSATPGAVAGNFGVPAGTGPLPVGGVVAPLPSPRQTDDGPDERENFSVADGTDVWVLDRPVPGSVVTVQPVIGGVPMTNATVSVDGEVVGQTNADGRYELQVPEDDTQRLQVEATRGDFTADGTVNVLHLSVSISPGSLLATPGQDVAVVVTRGEQRIENAAVSADGSDLGRTNESGMLTYQLPSDPTATVTAKYDGERTTAAVWPLYAGTLFVVALFVGLLAAFVSASVTVGYRLAGFRGVAVAIGGWFAIGAIVVASVVAGETGFAVAGLGVAVFTLLAVVVWHRRQLLEAKEGVSVSATRSWLVGVSLRASQGLDATLAWLLAVGTNFRGALRALPGWLQSAGRRALAGIRALPGRLRRLATTRSGKVVGAAIGAGLLVVGALAASYLLYGLPGLAGVAGVLVVAGLATLAWWLWPEFGDRETATDAGGTAVADVATAASQSGAAWLRGAWRQFARRVAPDRWRTSTPGEISRRALSLGLPREPVLELTRVFRDVEYGGRSLSEARRELAATAVDALEEQLTGNDGENE